MSNVIIEVEGVTLKTNSLYQFKGKYDASAVNGLKETGSTKVPMYGVGTWAQCRFENGLYDTGFYTDSPCYAGLPLEERATLVRILQEKIVQPYESIYGTGTLDNKNLEFWDSFGVDIAEDRVISTDTPLATLELYIALRGKYLTPPDKTGDPRYSSSQFVIADREVSSKKVNEQAINSMAAMRLYATLVTGEKMKLIFILRYLGVQGSDSFTLDTPDTTMDSIFHTFINRDIQNVKDFLRIVELSNKKVGFEEIKIYHELNRAQYNNTLTKQGTSLFMKDLELAADLKGSAKFLATHRGEDYKALKSELLLL